MTAPTHWSYSQFATLVECGMKYKLTKINHAPELPAWWNAGGNAFHEATEWYDRTTFPDGHTDDVARFAIEEGFLISFEKLKEKLQEKEPDTSLWRKANRGKEDEQFWLDLGPTLVKGYIGWRRENPNWVIYELPDGSPAIEVGFTATVGGQPVKGAIDRVMVDTNVGALATLDLKTGSRRPASNGQLRFYSTVWGRLFGDPIEYGAYYMARKIQLTDVLPLAPFPDVWLEDAHRMREQRIFLPHVTEMCKGCGVARFCPATGGADAADYEGVFE